MNFETLFIGVDGKRVVGSQETISQIDKVRTLECALESKQGIKITWDHLYNANPQCIFREILRDRESRVDQMSLTENKPPFCVITAVDGRAVRLEFYEGHEAFRLVYDLRANELQSKNLPKFIDQQPLPYDQRWEVTQSQRPTSHRFHAERRQSRSWRWPLWTDPKSRTSLISNG